MTQTQSPAAIPFLRPRLVKLDSFLPHLQAIDQSRIYSNFGPLNALFESRIRDEWFGRQGRVTTVGNATLGLMLAISQGKRRGRKALMPSFTFAATPLAAQWCGLEPVFVDVDPAEWVMSPAALNAALEKHGDDVAVVVPYATCGSAMDLAPYQQLLGRGIPVVVDAASSLGTMIDGIGFGSGFEGAIVYSMHATKAFPVGEGGLIYSANESSIANIRRAANFGFDSSRESQMLGMNAKMTEITAAVALATLDSFGQRRKARLALFQQYERALTAAGVFAAGFRLHAVRGEVAPQWLALRAPDRATQERVVAAASSDAIEVRRYFSPACHDHPQFASCENDGLLQTKALCDTVLSLPLWEEMSECDVARVVSAVRSSTVLAHA
jgi:dTDP-4-amino-4,6-dideoxygalactose transaminase